MQKLQEIEEGLHRIQKSFTKNPNRSFSIQNLIDKRQLLTDYIDQFNDELANFHHSVDLNTKNEVKERVKRVPLLRDSVSTFINSKEEEANSEGDKSEDHSDANVKAAEPGRSVKEVSVKEDIKMATIAFRDVEDAWVKDFEDVAKTCQWNGIQKYLFMRRLLRKAAKLAVEAAAEIATYDALKEFLEAEFAKEVKSVDLHKELRAKKKVSEETMLEYAYTMKRISGRGGVDDRSLIEYIVAGLSGNQSSKFTLLEAENFDELKTKLKLYDQLHEQLSDQRKLNI